MTHFIGKSAAKDNHYCGQLIAWLRPGSRHVTMVMSFLINLLSSGNYNCLLCEAACCAAD